MELASARLLRGQIPWRGLLLTASLLTYWSPLTTAQVTVDAVPPNVVEENSVLLLAHNMPQEFQVFYWYKGTTPNLDSEIARYIRSDNVHQTGPAYSGRETIYSNGSLFFQNVTKKDEGAYTLTVIDQQFNPIQTSVQFRVYP
ncbi:rCG53616, isoform CRA_b [Rattus norvegicus]|uniref:C-CAM4 n=2 Tax=Rattus norvegicus TaxID=10116 RepID=Q64724_RAT|nr:carcinoembryonic antigen-related cell adhesion molecule 4 precursor [Rattus norvegicus]AAC52591.1 C-CAM4 [Rattus norvegicus]EDM08074.1 rCG53616, isoform CRA_b [Rattus norvegicus]|eukprot:NP_775461.1 carcinoembryonic antigen-related cell adhesion molecule 4 precursor [Rattus norvegicus]